MQSSCGELFSILICTLYDELLPARIVKGVGNGKDILITTTGHIDNDGLIFLHFWRLFKGLNKGMGGFHGRDDPLGAHAQAERLQDLLVCGRFKTNPSFFT